MIGAQTGFTTAAEESFIPGRNEIEAVEMKEANEANGNPVPVETDKRQIALKPNFARLKKAMRKRAASIF